MSGVLLMITCAAILLYVSVLTRAAFTPGCSFANNQCVYTVQLGHAQQCDKPAITTQSDDSCCQNATQMYNQLKLQLDSLQRKVDALDSGSRSGDTNPGVSQFVLEELKQLKAELNSTKEELEREKENAASEIHRLHEKLSNSTTSLGRCQAAIGIETSTNFSADSDTGNTMVFYCNFDHDDCNLTISQVNHAVFGRSKATDMSPGSGPSKDHTKGLRYSYVLGLDTYTTATQDSIHRSTSRTGRAVTPTFDPAPATCIMFWYYMKGQDVKTLTVNLKINGGTGYPIYTLTGPQSDKWKLAAIDVDFEYTSHKFQVLLEATTTAYSKYDYRASSSHYINYDTHGNIVIDDMFIYNTTCKDVPVHPKDAIKFSDNGTDSYYTYHTHPLTWTEAYEVCRKQGPRSALVSIDSKAEQDFLVQTIQTDKTLSLIGQSGFFTSGNDIDSEHAFVWTDTGIPRAVPTGFWHSGQPNNVGGNQDCLLLEYYNDKYSWGDMSCNTNHPYICEINI